MSFESLVTRRRVLRSGGLIGSITLAGCLRETSTDTTGADKPTPDTHHTDGDAAHETPKNNTDPKPPESGTVVFVYDDGPIEDYTQAFPVHQEFDAPATTGIITNRIGRTDSMDIDHLEELEAAGWEIASHTTEHTPVGTFRLEKDGTPEQTRIYPTEIRHGYHHGKEIEITDGEQTVRRTVTGLKGTAPSPSIELNKPLGRSFAKRETIVRYPEEQMHEFLGESKRKLEQLGFEIDTFLAPYDNFDDWSRRFIEEYYTGVANAQHGSRINILDEFDPYQSRRDYFIEFTTPKAVKSDLNVIAEQSALGIVGAHTFKEDVSPDRIREMLEWIDERDIEVLTLREAISRCT